jgi:eukaryotic-like serine/threonine-protein kinase
VGPPLQDSTTDGPEPSPVTREDELVAAALEVLDEGGEVALSAFLSSHPEGAAGVRARVDHLRRIGLLDAGLSSSEFPERLGEFRLIRRIGGGGMGVVYLAVQESLGREVALKLIRPDLLYFEGARERFQREIEIVARLQHPGIVPIHTVGSAAGLPYFAMEFVRGCTLDAALNELAGRPASGLTGADLERAVKRASTGEEDAGTGGYLFEGSWEDTCLRIVQLVAEALEHAHQRGVIHRDVKPSNVMITPTSRAMLLDFGLSSTESDRRLTASTSHLGTLDYLPPEALDGGSRKLDQRADVYSLGVMLYQLFTGRAPYRRESTPATLASIAEGRPVPPRKLAPKLSWEAETVCLTAMDRDPARRYAGAGDFARDLQNVLERRPVEARRSSVFLRARRWVQRHPAAAVGIFLGSVVAVGGPLLDAAHQRELVRQKALQVDELTLAHAATDAQRVRAEQHLDEAMEAVDRFLTRVGEKDLAQVPQMETLRRKLLEDAVEFQRGFLAVESDDVVVRYQAARAQRRLGNLLVQLGRLDEAEASHQASIALSQALAAELPENVNMLTELASAQIDLSKLLGMAGRLADAEPVMKSALETLEALLERDPNHLRARALLVIDLANLGEVMSRTGRLELAREHLVRAVQEQRWLAEHDGGNAVRHRSVLASILKGLAELPRPAIDSKAGGDEFEETLRDTVERMASSSPQLEAYDRAVLASCRTLLASSLGKRGELAQANENAQAARTDLEELVESFPATVEYRDSLAKAEQVLGELAVKAGELDGALAHFDAADYLREDLTGGPAADPEWLVDRATTLESLAELAREGLGDESPEDLLERAAGLRRTALAPFPGHVDYRAALASNLTRQLAFAEPESEQVLALKRELAQLGVVSKP